MKREGRTGGDGWETAAAAHQGSRRARPAAPATRAAAARGSGSSGRPVRDPLRRRGAPSGPSIPRSWDEAFPAKELELVRVTLFWAARLLLEESIGSGRTLPSSPPTLFPKRRQDLKEH